MRVRPGTTAIVQNEGNTHIQARRSGVETTQPSVCAPHMYPFYYVAAGLGGSNHPSNVARRFAFETMTPRTARDAHIALRARQLGCETAILRVDAYNKESIKRNHHK